MDRPDISNSSLCSALRQAILQAQAPSTQAGTDIATGEAACLELSPAAVSGRYMSMTRQLAGLQTITFSNDAVAIRLSAADSAISDLALSHSNQRAARAVIAAATQAVSSAVREPTELLASVGTMQSQVANVNNQISVRASALKSQISNLDTADSCEGSTRGNGLATQIETANLLTGRPYGISLVNYL
jgi:flagellin-like hook-associated protein FlgL